MKRLSQMTALQGVVQALFLALLTAAGSTAESEISPFPAPAPPATRSPSCRPATGTAPSYARRASRGREGRHCATRHARPTRLSRGSRPRKLPSWWSESTDGAEDHQRRRPGVADFRAMLGSCGRGPGELGRPGKSCPRRRRSRATAAHLLSPGSLRKSLSVMNGRSGIVSRRPTAG